MKKIFSLKQAIMLVAVVLGGMTSSLKAQVTLIYPDATPSASYTTIQAAYNAIDFTAHAGAHTIQIESSYLSSAETFPITLGAKTAASASNKITITPATGTKVVIGPANQTVIATVTGSTFTTATTSVDLSSIITSGNISYLSGNANATDINITTTASSNAATITSGTLANGTYYISGNANIPARTTFTYSGNASITLSANATVTATGAASKVTPATNSFVSGIGTYAAAAFYNISGISGSVITVPAGTFTASSVANNKLYFGPAQTAAFKFNGATYVTIDGVSRTNISTGLTIQNPNCIYAQTIMFAGNSQYNTVKNCIIRGANQTGAWNNGYQGTVYFQAGTGNTCSYNTIDNNDIGDMNDPNIPYPICAFQMTAAGGTNTNQTVSNNNIYNISNQYSNGTTCAAMQFGGESASTGNAVLNNRIYWTGAATFSTACNVINCGTLGLNNRFEGNTIGYTSSAGTGTADLTYTVSGGTIYVISNPKNFTCKNNTIANLKITSPNGAKAFVCYQIPAASAAAQANADNCYGNTAQNIELNSNGGNGTLYGIMLPAAPIYDLDIKNNVVKNLTCQSTSASYSNTIYGVSMNFAALSINITTTSGSTAATLASASLSNGTTYSIYGNANIPNGTTFTYSGSTAVTLSAAATATASAIASTLSNIDINCIANEISNLTAGKSGSSAANVIVAFMSGGCSNIYEKNLIYNLNTISSGTSSVIKALRFATSKVDGITVKNNIVRLGTDVTSDAEISAIIDEGLSSNGHPFNIYHNSVFIGGGTGLTLTKPSHCFNYSTGANYGNIVIKNNIFCNVRTGGAVNQIINTMTLPAINVSGNNLYKYGSQFATVTTTNPSTYTTLTDWNSDRGMNVLNVDANSVNQSDPQFVDPTAFTPDLHVSAGSPANETGTPIATVTDDFSAATRSDYTNAPATSADMGAYVIFSATALDDPKQISGMLVYGVQNNIRFANLSGKNASIYALSGQLLKSVKLTSDNVTEPVATGLYIVNVNGEVSKVMVK